MDAKNIRWFSNRRGNGTAIYNNPDRVFVSKKFIRLPYELFLAVGSPTYSKIGETDDSYVIAFCSKGDFGAYKVAHESAEGSAEISCEAIIKTTPLAKNGHIVAYGFSNIDNVLFIDKNDSGLIVKKGE